MICTGPTPVRSICSFIRGRQIEGQRILIVGTYRPADVPLPRDGERHPLEALVHEFQRRWGDNQLDLSLAEGRQLVEALLDSDPNRLGPDFREALFQHTQGQAGLMKKGLYGSP